MDKSIQNEIRNNHTGRIRINNLIKNKSLEFPPESIFCTQRYEDAMIIQFKNSALCHCVLAYFLINRKGFKSRRICVDSLMDFTINRFITFPVCQVVVFRFL